VLCVCCRQAWSAVWDGSACHVHCQGYVLLSAGEHCSVSFQCLYSSDLFKGNKDNICQVVRRKRCQFMHAASTCTHVHVSAERDSPVAGTSGTSSYTPRSRPQMNTNYKPGAYTATKPTYKPTSTTADL